MRRRKLDVLLEQTQEEAKRIERLSPDALVVVQGWLDHEKVLLAIEAVDSDHDPVADAERRGKSRILDQLNGDLERLIEEKRRIDTEEGDPNE